MHEITTFSILTGGEACNAKCPFCVAQMTPNQGVPARAPVVNYNNFKIAMEIAKRAGCLTAMLTGKGEPTIWPEQITEFLKMLDRNFPLVELQTNAILLASKYDMYEQYLKDWHILGLRWINISVVSYDEEANTKNYGHRIDRKALIAKLHDLGFSVRLNVIMVKGVMDSCQEVQKMIRFARENKVEHLTLTPVNKPISPANQEKKTLQVFDWTSSNHVDRKDLEEIREYLESEGTPLMTLPHGAIIYDVDGQNVCYSNCLTFDHQSNVIRQLIYFPDGHLRYSWQHSGAILL